MQERVPYLMISGLCGPGSRHDYHVQTTIELLLMQPITFSDESCDSVPDDAVAYLLAHGDADPVPFLTVSSHIKDQISVCVRSAAAVALPEILLFFQRFPRFQINLSIFVKL